MLHLISKLVKPFHIGILLLSMVVLFAGCASQKAAKGDAAEANKLITAIITSEDNASTTVTVKGNRALTYTALKQVFPRGVLIDFPETYLDNIKTVYYPPENEFISSIRTTQIEENGKTSRIFIALKRDLPYSIEPDAARLKIVFLKSDKPAAETPPKAARAEETTPAPKPGPAKAPAPPATRMTSVSATPLKRNVVITIKADGTVTKFKSFTISQTPPRIVYDIYKLKSPFKGEQRIAVNSDQVRKIRHFGHPDKIRIVLETNKANLSKHTARPTDNGMQIYVGQAPPPVSEDKPKTIESLAAKPMSAGTEKSQPVGHDKPAWLNRIDFTSEEAGKSQIIVGTTRPVEYKMIKVDSKRLHLKLLNTNLPEYRKRALITTRFQSAVDRITPIYRPKSKDTVVDVELREGVPYVVKQTDDVIRVSFAASKIPPRPYEDAKLPAWKKAMAEPPSGLEAPKAAAGSAGSQVAETLTRVEAGGPQAPRADAGSAGSLTAQTPARAEASGPQAPRADAGSAGSLTAQTPAKAEALPSGGQELKLPVAQETPRTAKKEMSFADRLGGSAPPGEKYTGEKIALDFYDTDIKNVFRIIREISGKNFAIDKNVTGKVTLTLDKPVPWDQVLELVLKMNQLGLKMEGDIVRIATLSSLAQEEKLLQAQLKATEQAEKQKKALEPLVTAYLPVSYSDAASEVAPHIASVLTEGRGTVTVDTRNNQLVLTDTAEKIDQIREIVMRIDQVTPQVVIEARIVEANTSFTKDLGFDWGTVSAGPIDIGSSTLVLEGFANNIPQAIPSGIVGATFQKLSGTPFSIIDAQLLVSETEGKTNIISAPKVVTLDNKKAKIKQGLEVPYQERDSSGNSTVRFKNVDLLLEVTPNVTPDNRIVMKIFVTKNDVFEQTPDGPALSTNEAQTELLIENGDTIVIGGIVKSTITYGEKGIPGLRKIGVLGWLFKSQEKTDSKNELLIFITPRIVQLQQKNKMDI